MHCLVPEAVMKEFVQLLGFELYSQLCSPLSSAQEESAVSVTVNQPGSQQLPLTLLGVLLCSIKKVLHEAQSAILAFGDVLAVSHPSPEAQQPRGSSLLS